MIIDAHCHVASEEHIPRSFVDGAIANMVAALSAQGMSHNSTKLVGDLFLQKMQDPQCDELVAEMDNAGISKSILLIPDFTYTMKACALTIEESFKRHLAILCRHPGRFEVFGGVDPRWGKDGLDLFARSLVEYGFKGLKVYPPCGYSPSDPSLFPYYALCAEYRVPVVVHIGPTSPALAFGTTYPFLLDEAARKFPTVAFILAHGAVNFTEESAMFCAYRPNVYLDMSGYQSTLMREEAFQPVNAALARGICHKILFGTDWPVFRLQGSQRTFVDALVAVDRPLARLTASQRGMVLSSNAERLLKPGESRPAKIPLSC